MPDHNYFANLIWQIADHIARETAKLDPVRIAAERSIALPKERRVALVAAVVTGQIEVVTI